MSCVLLTFLNLLCISQDHKEEVTCVSFNANDSAIASGSTSGDLVLHSLTTNVSSRAFGHGSNQVRLSSFEDVQTAQLLQHRLNFSVTALSG